MSQKYLNLFKKNKYPLFYLFLVLILVVTNYKWGTWLIGWDVIMPELGFKFNFSRFLHGSWLQFEGLGAFSIMQKTADMPRLMFLWFTSIFLPNSLLRYLYQFIMLFLGPLGVYYLLKNQLLPKKSKRHFEFAFLGGLFYLLNLGTLQVFYTPLSMFSCMYGLLPWLIYFFLKYLDSGKIKDLIVFSAVSLFATPLAVTTTNFIVYGLIIFLFGLVEIFTKRRLKKLFTLGLAIFAINAYWLLPFINATFIGAGGVISSKISYMSSEDSFALNRQYGLINDVAILRGFWFKNIDYFPDTGIFSRILNTWADHVGSILIYSIGILGFISILFGLFSVLKRRILIAIPFVLVFLLSVFMLINQNFPFGFVFGFLRDNSSLFKEVFRFPYTKFIIPAIFSYSVLFSYGLFYIWFYLKDKMGVKITLQYFVGFWAFLLIFYTFPFFKGGLFYDNLQVKIPGEYFEVFDYFDKQPKSARIANLPQPTFWGWNYTNWGYRGSGFLWYGIEQPITDRAFDVWNYKNEQFYNEFQYAIYSENAELLAYVLQKYQVNYLLLDKNVITPGAPRATFYPQTMRLLAKTEGVSLDKEFGAISVYRVAINNEQLTINNYVYAPDEFDVVDSIYEFSNVDPSYFSSKVDYVYLNNETLNTKLETNQNSLNSNVLNFLSFGNWDLFRNSQSPDSAGKFEISNLNLPISKFVYPFSDDKELANSLQDDSNLFITPGILSVPNMFKSTPLPASVSLQGESLLINYIYPSIKNSAGQLIYAPSYSEKVDITGNNSSQILLNSRLLNPLSAKTYLLDNNSKAVVFSTQSVANYNFSDYIQSAEPSDCGGSENGSYGKLVKGSQITLIAKNHNVCTTFSNKIVTSVPSVVRVEYTYKSDTNAKPLYCLTADKYNCLNQKYENSAFESDVYAKYIDYVYLPNGVISDFSLILENPELKESSVDIKDINISVYNVSSVIDLAPGDMAYNTNAVLDLQNESGVSLVIPDYGDLNKNYLPGTKYFNSNKKNCDNFNQKDFSRELNGDSPLQGLSPKTQYFNYKALDAISCDSVKATNLQGSSSYLVTFNYQNITGKALDICIAGTNLDKCMVLDRLERSKINNEQLTINNDNPPAGGQKQSFILPSYPSVKEYNINIGNQSIGRVPTENNLYSIETKYVPYEWVKALRLINNEELRIKNGVEIVSVNHKYPHRYDVKINNEQLIINNEIASQARNDGYGLLVLNQSFEKGWGIYSKDTCKLGIVSPITCNPPAGGAEHILAKNWANGWIIGTVPDQGQSLNIEYLILFWPQWLQYMGYLFLLAWGATLSVLFWRSRA